MADVIVVGDGPGALSAALFMARAQLEVMVIGADQSPMHEAKLHNYLGIESMTGTEFLALGRQQASDAGATMLSAEVVAASATATQVAVRLATGEVLQARYLILSEGVRARIARSLGLAARRQPVKVDRNCRTAHPRIWAVGAMIRPARSQAIASAGDGCVAALDIVAEAYGRPHHVDWDATD